jgi:hypothetical protein
MSDGLKAATITQKAEHFGISAATIKRARAQ